MIKKSIHKEIILIASLLFIGITLFLEMLCNSFNARSIIYLLSCFILFFDVIVMYNLYKCEGTILKITLLFCVMFILYMYGQVILNIFNLTADGSLLSNKFSAEEIVHGLVIVNIFFAVFLMGIVTAKKRVKKDLDYVEFEDKKLVTTGVIVLICSAPFELYVNISKLYFTFSYGYASLYQDIALQSISSGYKILSYFFLPGCFYILFGSKRKSKGEKIASILVLLHAATEMLIGYRASAIIPVIIILYCLHVKASFSKSAAINRKTKKTIIKSCLLASLVVVFIFPMVRATRNSGGLTLTSILTAFSVENFRELFTTVNDMGKSLQTVIFTIRLVPTEYPYRYGVSYLMNLTQIIPNFFWTRHPAEVYGSLGKWLTRIVDPAFYQYGGSLGFSCVAESYINFGYVGITVFPFIFGRILQTVEEKIDASAKPVNYASLCIVSVYLMSYARGEFSDVVRGFFWYMLIPYVTYKYFIKRGERN